MNIKARYLIIIAMIALVVLIILEIPLGRTIYVTKDSLKVLEIPNLVKFKEEVSASEVKFQTLRSKWGLQKDINKFLSKYQKINCGGKTYYYNEEKDFTVSRYEIKKKWLNEISIYYASGNTCDIDTSLKKIELIPQEYTLEEAKNDGYFVVQDGKYFNKKAYDEFKENTNNGLSGVLRIITLTKNHDLIITDLHYENKKFKVVRDSTRDKDNKENYLEAYNFESIGIYDNKLYAYNGKKLTNSVANSKKDALYLFDIYE